MKYCLIAVCSLLALVIFAPEWCDRIGNVTLIVVTVILGIVATIIYLAEEMLEYAKSYCEGFDNYSEEYDPAEDYAAKDIEKDY